MIRNKNLLTHVMVSIGFLLIPFLFLAGEMASFHRGFQNPYDSFTIVGYLFLLSFYYLNHFVLIPNYYFPKKYVQYISILVLIFTVLMIIYYLLDHRFHHHHAGPWGHGAIEGSSHEDGPGGHQVLTPQFQGNGDRHHESPIFRHPPPIFQVSQMLFLYLIGIFVNLYVRIKKNMDAIEVEKNNAELSYLKSQINPHFLFNTFNSIYSLAIRENAERTANGMLKLSGMMRYVVSESSSEFVPLEKEITYINNFIELQKLRLDKGVKFDYELQGSFEGKRIAPLLLIPFIENAFKHGVNPDENSSILIKIEIGDDDLHLYVENNKVTTYHEMSEKMGFGIENTKNRLKLLYPSKHTIVIIDTNKKYQVNLKLTFV